MREGVEQYLGKARKCSCGRVHETPLKRVVIEPDALQKVPGILEELGYHRVFLCCRGELQPETLLCRGSRGR